MPATRTQDTARLMSAFTDHPASVGESYWQHMGVALGFSVRLLRFAAMAFVHALVPAWYETTVSRNIIEMAEGMKTRNASR